MTISSIRERYALDLFEPIWRRKGYTVVREPNALQVPKFLEGFKPDAIATGAQPALVIEVAAGQGPTKESRLHRLRSALEGQADWRLEVVYVGSEGVPVHPASLDASNSALERANQLAGAEPNAAMLLAWAALEAIARVLEPSLTEFALGALAIVDLLVGYGHLSQEDGATLRALALERNRIAHGDLDSAITGEQVKTLTHIAKQLVLTAELVG